MQKIIIDANNLLQAKLILDIDVLRLMAANAGVSVHALDKIISQFDYSTYELATYLVLLQQKELLGVRNFRMWGMNTDRVGL